MRVLVVDDDWEFRDELAALLTDKGHTTTGVPSAAMAINALEREEFDIMFTDLKMGRRSGMDLSATARKQWPRLIVVMLTGTATVETAVRPCSSARSITSESRSTPIGSIAFSTL